MKRIFLLIIFIIFLSISCVNAQDNDTSIDESPDVSIEVQRSNETIYPGDQVEMTVTVKNIGNCDVNNLSIIELESLGKIWYSNKKYELGVINLDAPDTFDTLYYGGFEPITPNWNFTKEPVNNISSHFHANYESYYKNHNRTFNTFHLIDTLKVNQSSSFKMIFNTTKHNFYEKVNVFYFLVYNDTLLNNTSNEVKLSQFSRTFYVTRKIVEDMVYVDVNISSQDNATFSGKYDIKIANYNRNMGHYPEYYFYTYLVDIVNNTGNISLKLPLKVGEKHATGIIPWLDSPNQCSLYSDRFVFNSINENPLYPENKPSPLWSDDFTIPVIYLWESHDLVKVYKNDSQFVVKDKGFNMGPYVLTVNGVSYNRSVEKGSAKLNINLEPGVYPIEIVDRVGNWVINQITVLPTLIADDLVKYYKNDSQFYIKLIDYDSNPVKSENITFNINGVFYSRETDDEGIAKLNINLEPGVYILTARDPITGLQMSYNIKVLPKLSGFDVMANGNSAEYWVKLVDDEGNALSGQPVTFNINGVIFNNVTDNNGEALLLVNLMSGSYIVTAEYLSLRISNTITVFN